MRRTADRPLPAGRLGSAEVLVFGAATIVIGFVYLALAGQLADRGLGPVDLVRLCLDLHAAENPHVGQHGRRCRGRRAAGADGLGRRSERRWD